MTTGSGACLVTRWNWDAEQARKTSKHAGESIFEADLARPLARSARSLAETTTSLAKSARRIAKLAMSANRGMLNPGVGNQSGNGRPPVKSASQTYLLSLAPAEFEQVTRAIMLQSNKTVKLQ
jgi:hypothetical protein